MNEETLDYYLSKKEPEQSCLLAMKNIIFNQDENITETIKWGFPCFSYKGKIFCFLSVDKKTDEPYILFWEGNNLDHPELEKGDRVKMKVFRVNPNIDLPIKTVVLLINKALDLYRNGTIKIKQH